MKSHHQNRSAHQTLLIFIYFLQYSELICLPEKDMRVQPLVRKITWRRKMANLLQYSCLENSLDRRAWSMDKRLESLGMQRVRHDLAAEYTRMWQGTSPRCLELPIIFLTILTLIIS